MYSLFSTVINFSVNVVAAKLGIEFGTGAYEIFKANFLYFKEIILEMIRNHRNRVNNSIKRKETLLNQIKARIFKEIEEIAKLEKKKQRK